MIVRGREVSDYSASMDTSTEPLWLPVKAYVAEQMPLEVQLTKLQKHRQ